MEGTGRLRQEQIGMPCNGAEGGMYIQSGEGDLLYTRTLKDIKISLQEVTRTNNLLTLDFHHYYPETIDTVIIKFVIMLLEGEERTN